MKQTYFIWLLIISTTNISLHAEGYKKETISDYTNKIAQRINLVLQKN